jgi:hypothetical protein
LICLAASCFLGTCREAFRRRLNRFARLSVCAKINWKSLNAF